MKVHLNGTFICQDSSVYGNHNSLRFCFLKFDIFQEVKHVSFFKDCPAIQSVVDDLRLPCVVSLVLNLHYFPTVNPGYDGSAF